jgi:tetratricopeptide (TPR) repeat protein
MMTANHNAKDLFSEGMGEFVNARYDKCVELLSKALGLDSEFKLAFIGRGSAFLKLERLHEARADFDRALAIDPSYARAFHLRGLVREKLGDDAAAVKDFDRAVSLDPQYGAAYYSRAALHSKLSNADQALDDMQMATHLGSLNLERYMNTENIWHTQQMRVEDAIETELQR